MNSSIMITKMTVLTIASMIMITMMRMNAMTTAV